FLRFFFFSSRRRHTRFSRDWSSDVCSSDLRLRPDELEGASLITASALLDMLTADELERLVRSCVTAACPALITLSVIGGVHLARSEERRVGKECKTWWAAAR